MTTKDKEVSGGVMSSVRLYGLDALRGVGAVLVVAIHAAIPYATIPLCTVNWPVIEPSRSAAIDAVQWWIEGFVMPLFFVVAGFCAAGLLVLQGRKTFLTNRALRVFSPHLAAIVLILPATFVIWMLGWMTEGRNVPFPSAERWLSIPDDIEAEMYGNAHLWFLQYLLVYCVVLCGLSRIWQTLRGKEATRAMRSWGARRWLRRTLAHPAGVAVLMIPCVAILWLDPHIVTGAYQTIFPVYSKLAYYAIYFFAGALWHRFRGAFADMSQHHVGFLIASALTFMPAWRLIDEYRLNGLTAGGRLVLAVSLAVFAWTTTLGMIGLFLRRELPWRGAGRYLGEASYWVYLVHFPIVGLTQVVLFSIAIPVELKWGIVTAFAMTMTLLSYQVMVRHTWIGEFLNGRRIPRSGSATIPPVVVPSTLPLKVAPAIEEPARKAA